MRKNGFCVQASLLLVTNSWNGIMVLCSSLTCPFYIPHYVFVSSFVYIIVGVCFYHVPRAHSSWYRSAGSWFFLTKFSRLRIIIEIWNGTTRRPKRFSILLYFRSRVRWLAHMTSREGGGQGLKERPTHDGWRIRHFVFLSLLPTCFCWWHSLQSNVSWNHFYVPNFFMRSYLITSKFMVSLYYNQ